MNYQVRMFKAKEVSGEKIQRISAKERRQVRMEIKEIRNEDRDDKNSGQHDPRVQDKDVE
jgi:hypothetical protein